MDQSTQVNFPILIPTQHRINKHHTCHDLYRQQNYNFNRIYKKSMNNRPNRPRSVNIPLKYSTSTSNCSVINCRNYHQQFQPNHEQFQPIHDRFMINIKANGRERESPFSSNSNSSVISGTCNNNKKPPIDDVTLSTPATTTTNCKCCFNTRKGLSWRRLHMSRAKLKATATTSELLSGFAMVAMVELQINEPTNVPEWLFILFAICTTILVSVHIFALMISTYILPNIDAIAKLDNTFYLSHNNNNNSNINSDYIIEHSPHEYMKNFIELAWAFSTILGLFLFLVEIAILCWVKFWDYSFNAAIASTIVIIPILVIFVLFSLHFYHSLLVYKSNSSIQDIEKLDEMKKQLDQQIITSPV